MLDLRSEESHRFSWAQKDWKHLLYNARRRVNCLERFYLYALALFWGIWKSPPPNKECAVLYSAWIEMFSIEYFYLIKNCLVVNNFLLLKIVLFHLSGWKGVESKLKCVKVSFQTSLFNEHCNVMAPFQTSLFNEHCNVTAPFKNSALKICKNTPTCLFKN